MANSLNIEETIYADGTSYAKVVQLTVDFEFPYINNGQIMR